MATKDNPHNSGPVQALVDLIELGLGATTVADAVTRINNDRDLRQAADAIWSRHMYPDRRIVYVQLGVEQRLLTLDNAELRVLTLLGMYAHQTGLIQIRRQDIAAACGLSEREVARALRGLVECGAIRIEVERRRHEANIYMVHPGLYNKGRRIPSDVAGYEAELTDDQRLGLITRRDLPSVLQTEAVRTEDYLYNRVTLIPADQAKSAAEATATAKSVRKRRVDAKRDCVDDDSGEGLPWESAS